MDCQAIVKMIPLYMDRELQPTEMQQVREHLSGCAACQKEFEAFEASWALLGELEEVQPEPGFIGRFWTRLSFEQTWQEKLAQALKGDFFKRRLVPVLVAVCLVVVVGAVSLRHYARTRKTKQIMAGLTQDDLAVVEYIELAENFDVIQEIDFLEDMEAIEQMEIPESGFLKKTEKAHVS